MFAKPILLFTSFLFTMSAVSYMIILFNLLCHFDQRKCLKYLQISDKANRSKHDQSKAIVIASSFAAEV